MQRQYYCRHCFDSNALPAPLVCVVGQASPDQLEPLAMMEVLARPGKMVNMHSFICFDILKSALHIRLFSTYNEEPERLHASFDTLKT